MTKGTARIVNPIHCHREQPCTGASVSSRLLHLSSPNPLTEDTGPRIGIRQPHAFIH